MLEKEGFFFSLWKERKRKRK